MAAGTVYATRGEGGTPSSGGDFYAHIKELDLSEAGQLIINEDVPAFHRMSSLRSLIVSNSNLSHFQPRWFSGMDNNRIAFVDVSSNQLQDLQLEQRTLPMLQQLNLSGNSIHTISLRDFDTLETLNLNGNQLQSLDFLQQFRQLKNLYAENNDIKHVRAMDFQRHLPTLEHVSLAINFISQIDSSSFDQLTNLRYLNLSHNSLRGLHFFTILTQLTKLEVLDMSFNELREVPSLKLLKMSNLQQLNFSNNFIGELAEKSLAGLFSLRRLNLQNNAIRSVHANAFNQLFDLTYLDLSSNKLTAIDANLLTIPSIKLKRLFLGDNQLAALAESTFLNTRKLIQLDLSRNKIRQLPDSLLREMLNLRVLHLEHNELESFSLAQLDQTRQLRVVFLHYNRLTHIDDFDASSLGLLAKATILTIDNNPWQCACMDHMIALLAQAKINYSFERGYFENETKKTMCVVTDDCYADLAAKHETYIRELFFGKF